MPKNLKINSCSPWLNTLLCLAGLPLCFLSASVWADMNDPLNFIAGLSAQHDDNLFRLPGAVRSDNITSGYVGVKLDKKYAQQQFNLDYSLTAYKYQKNNYLDFNAQNYKGAWLWTLTPSLKGTISADRQQQLNDYQDYRNFNIQNVRISQTQHFEADFSPHGVWHLLGGTTRTEFKNSQKFIEQDDFNMNALDAGVRYDYRSGTSISLMGHDRAGNYLNRGNPTPLYDNGFNEKEGEAKLDWMLSGKSKINLRAAYVKREHDHFTLRDYSGAVGRLDYIWTPEGKVQFTLSAFSDLGSYQTNYSSYTRNNTLSISPAYAMTDKITLVANASVSERTFLGMGVSSSGERVDTAYSESIGINWMPLRSLTLGGNLLHSSRNSNYTGLNFTDTTAGMNANLFF